LRVGQDFVVKAATLAEIALVAFHDRTITSPNHPLIDEMRCGLPPTDNFTPQDVETFNEGRHFWFAIQDDLIAEINADYGGVYDENRSFSQERFAAWLVKMNIPWPALEDDHLDLEDDTFREMEKAYPIVAPLRCCSQHAVGISVRQDHCRPRRTQPHHLIRIPIDDRPKSTK
jgi:hypothetical protein